MILRRLMDHVRDQNWFAVGLDFLIVVFGVFIGFQLTAWSQSQADARQGWQYSQDLLSDLRAEVRAGEFISAYYETVEHHARTALNLFDSNDPGQDEQFLISLYNASQFLTSGRFDATYSALLAQGDLEMIEPDALKRTVIRHYTAENLERLSDWVLESDYRKRLRRTMPIEVQDLVRLECGDIRDEDGRSRALSWDCDLDFGEIPVSEIADALRENRELQADLVLMTSTLENYIDDVRTDKRMLSAELERFN